MKKILLTIFFALGVAMTAMCPAAAAQDDKTPEQREKEFREAIEKQVERMETQLNLEPWQVFYADSILTHDYMALQAEFAELSAGKVSNVDLFYDVQDKWMEQMYQAFRKILNDKQWAQYEKSGAARDKKARDKRAAKKKSKPVK